MSLIHPFIRSSEIFINSSKFNRLNRILYRKNCPTFTHNKIHEYCTKINHYDIIVAGGGMVGFAMACSLGRTARLAGRKILLLERAPKKSWVLPNQFSNRVCAIGGSSQKLFKQLGVWDNIMSMRAQPVVKMQVWESCSEAMISFDKDNPNEIINHIIENDVILEAIKQQVPQSVSVIYDADVDSYELSHNFENKALINLKNGEKFSADLLIGADGVNSLVRRTMCSQYLQCEYDQMGIVATLELSEVFSGM